jgi:hypothetical protein
MSDLDTSVAWKDGAKLVENFVKHLRALQSNPVPSESLAVDILSKFTSKLILKALRLIPKESKKQEPHLAFYIDGDYVGTKILNEFNASENIHLEMYHHGSYNIKQISENSYNLMFTTSDDDQNILVKMLGPLHIVPAGIQLGSPPEYFFKSFKDLFEEMSKKTTLDKFLYFQVPTRYIVRELEKTPEMMGHHTHILAVSSPTDVGMNDASLFTRIFETNNFGMRTNIQTRIGGVDDFMAGLSDVIENSKPGDDVVLYVSLPGRHVTLEHGKILPMLAFSIDYTQDSVFPMEVIELWCNILFLVKRVARVTIFADVSFDNICAVPEGCRSRSLSPVVDMKLSLKSWIDKHAKTQYWLKHSYHMDKSLEVVKWHSQAFHPRRVWFQNCVCFLASDFSRAAAERIFPGMTRYNGVFTYNLVPELINPLFRRTNISELCHRLIHFSSDELPLQKPSFIFHPNCGIQYIVHYSPPTMPVSKLKKYRETELLNCAKLPVPNSFSVVALCKNVCELSGGFVAGIRVGDRFQLVNGSPTVSQQISTEIFTVNNSDVLRSQAVAEIEENTVSSKTSIRAVQLPPDSLGLQIDVWQNDKKCLDEIVDNIKQFHVVSALLHSNNVRKLEIRRFRHRDEHKIISAINDLSLYEEDTATPLEMLVKGQIATLWRRLSSYMHKFLDTPFNNSVQLEKLGAALEVLKLAQQVYFTAPCIHDPSKIMVACAPTMPVLLPYMINLYYWQCVKVNRMMEVNSFAWRNYPNHKPLDSLAATQIPGNIAPSLSLYINGKNDEKKLWKHCQKPDTLITVKEKRLDGKMTVGFYYHIDSVRPATWPAKREAAFKYHVIKITPFMSNTLLTQENNLAGHGINHNFIPDWPRTGGIVLSRLGTDVITDEPFINSFLSADIFDKSTNRFLHGIESPSHFYIIMMVEHQECVNTQFDVRYLQQCTGDQTSWIRQGDVKQVITPKFIESKPNAPGIPIPIHVDIIHIQR